MEILLHQLNCPVILCWMLESYTESQLRYEGGGVLYTLPFEVCVTLWVIWER